MDIIAAVKEALKKGRGYAIIRTSWEMHKWGPVVPTNTPDGYIVIIPKEKTVVRWWHPTAGDITAEDWRVAELSEYGFNGRESFKELSDLSAKTSLTKADT